VSRRIVAGPAAAPRHGARCSETGMGHPNCPGEAGAAESRSHEQPEWLGCARPFNDRHRRHAATGRRSQFEVAVSRQYRPRPAQTAARRMTSSFSIRPHRRRFGRRSEIGGAHRQSRRQLERFETAARRSAPRRPSVNCHSRANPQASVARSRHITRKQRGFKSEEARLSRATARSRKLILNRRPRGFWPDGSWVISWLISRNI